MLVLTVSDSLAMPLLALQKNTHSLSLSLSLRHSCYAALLLCKLSLALPLLLCRSLAMRCLHLPIRQVTPWRTAVAQLGKSAVHAASRGVN